MALLSSEDGARRSAVCVRACEGIPTELLERGFLLRLIAACVHVDDGRVQEALEELVSHRLRLADRKLIASSRSTPSDPGSATRPVKASPGQSSARARQSLSSS